MRVDFFVSRVRLVGGVRVLSVPKSFFKDHNLRMGKRYRVFLVDEKKKGGNV